MPLIQDGNEDDYDLVEGTSVWIQVGLLQIYIRDADGGVTVDIYGSDTEQVPLASTYAAHKDA